VTQTNNNTLSSTSMLPPLPPLLPKGSALFLDFDGTLVPIAARPQDIHVPAWVLPTLKHARDTLDGALAIVTGRPLAEIDEYLDPLRLAGAGIHGAERRRPDGLMETHAARVPAPIVRAVEALAHEHRELMIETKHAALALHYRAAPQLQALCMRVLDGVVREFPEWIVMPGHAVFEVKLRGLSKGTAVQAFLGEEPFAGRRPVVVGDDTTDEDAFEAALRAGGYGIKVGGGATLATYALTDPAAVCRWLAASSDALAARADRTDAAR